MITNEWIPGTSDISEPLAVRREVFVTEQGVPEEIELDEADRTALHLMIRDGEEPIAAGRVWHDGSTFRIGRCAVRRGYRGQGIGDLLVKLLLVKAFEYDPSEVRLHAQIPVQAFYERYGFEPLGEQFTEGGILHITMRVTKQTARFPSKCGETCAAECGVRPTGEAQIAK